MAEEKKKQEKPKCIFCEILKGSQKAMKVFDQGDFVVILDAFPITEGHVLILPKEHKKDVTELTKDETASIFNLARSTALVMAKELEADSVNIATAPSVVQHFHLHVIPRYSYDMMGPLADLDNKRELPKEVMERIAKKLQGGFDAIKKV